MGNIYKGQTKLVIKISIGIDLQGVEAKIHYKKPSGVEGSWPASIVNEKAGIISYSIQSTSDLDESGDWYIWPKITTSDGKLAPGKSVLVKVLEEGR